MLKKSLIPLAAISVAFLPPSTEAQPMSPDQREKLSKQLGAIINKSEAKLTSRQATAYKAYKGALGSNSAALALYLKCIEKVNFLDAGKKNSDFRNWKRAQKDHLSNPAFQLALRHQLNWLVLTIEVTRSEGTNYAAQSPTVLSAVNNIFGDAQKLKGQHGILRKSVLGSVFVKAYGFRSDKIRNWPTAPLNIAQIFDKVVLPPLRDSKNASKVHSAWLQRISYEEQMLELWAPKPQGKSIGLKKNFQSPAYTKFIENQRPNLIWRMEVDTFKAGDEYRAGSRMLTHLSRYINHSSARKWAKELNGLIAAGKKVKKPHRNEKKPPEAKETPEPSNDNGGYIELPVN